MINLVGFLLLALPALLFVYAYVGYPIVLRLSAAFRARPAKYVEPREWPQISISLPVYNEAAQVRAVIESLLRLDYPSDRKQILVISDASSDGTDEIVREFSSRGVELLRLPRRAGKTAAEEVGAARLRGSIVVNTDASIRIHPDALKPLIARFSDPTVGVASGRDVSVAATGETTNVAEAGYVGYEMVIRALETRVGGIIGASGCFYAIRTQLHRVPLPAHLSRDFASALIAREHGFRAVSVDEAICYVPRTGSLDQEYNRKVRTISRGMETLLHKRHLLNPFRYGVFAWMLFSHKVCRWLTPCGLGVALVGLLLLDGTNVYARWLTAGLLIVAAVAGHAIRRWPAAHSMPRVLGLISSVAVANAATVHALIKAIHGDQNAVWEPTRRDVPLPTP